MTQFNDRRGASPDRRFGQVKEVPDMHSGGTTRPAPPKGSAKNISSKDMHTQPQSTTPKGSGERGDDRKRWTKGVDDHRGDAGGTPIMKKPKGPKPQVPSKARA